MHDVPERDAARIDQSPKQPVVPMPLALILFVLAGAPLAFLSWRTLSALLAGRVEAGSTLLGVVALVVLVFLLRGLGMYLKRL